MNIARGRRFSCQQVGAQQLRVQRRRDRAPEERGLDGSVALAGYCGRRSNGRPAVHPDRDDAPLSFA